MSDALSWVLGVIGTVISAGMIAWLTALHTRLQIYGQDIAVLKSQITGVSERLDKIEEKLDRLLERS